MKTHIINAHICLRVNTVQWILCCILAPQIWSLSYIVYVREISQLNNIEVVNNVISFSSILATNNKIY